MQAGIKLRSPLTVSLPAHDGQKLCFSLEALSTTMIVRRTERNDVHTVFRRKSGYSTHVLNLLNETLKNQYKRLNEISEIFAQGIEAEVFLPAFYPDMRSLVVACASNFMVGINHLAGKARLEETRLISTVRHSSGLQEISHPCEINATVLGGIFFMQAADEHAIFRIYTPPGLYLTLFGLDPEKGRESNFTSEDFNSYESLENSRLSMEVAILGLIQSDFDAFRQAMNWRRGKQKDNNLTMAMPKMVSDLLIERALGWEQLPHSPLWLAFFQNQTDAEELSIAWQKAVTKTDEESIFLISKVDTSGTIIQ